VLIESGQIVLTTDKLTVGYERGNEGAQPLDTGGESVNGARAGTALRVRMADTLVQRGDRIGLVGPNGAGKTTLLRTLIGQLAPLDGRATLGHNVQVGYYAQTHDSLNPRRAIIDEIRAVSHLSEEGARSYLGRFLFSGDDVFKLIGALSGGERSRVALAKLTLQGANFLVLDEPTNHLDLPSRQALEAILGQYDGTLIFVSHDRYFVDALATTLWVLDDGEVRIFAGNYTKYRTQRAQARQAQNGAQGKAAGGATTQATQATSAEAQRKGTGARRPAARTQEQVEAEIARLEARLAAVEDELAAASEQAEVRRIAELGAEYERTKADLDALYGEWALIAS
jgi:ATP-binding cassette subfamily F protein 3